MKNQQSQKSKVESKEIKKKKRNSLEIDSEEDEIVERGLEEIKNFL